MKIFFSTTPVMFGKSHAGQGLSNTYPYKKGCCSDEGQVVMAEMGVGSLEEACKGVYAAKWRPAVSHDDTCLRR